MPAGAVYIVTLVEFGTLAEFGTTVAWPSTLLARWPIVELAGSINIPQWHLTTKVHSRKIEKKQRKLKKADENSASTIRTMRA